MIQTSRTLIESADVVYSKLTQAQRAGKATSIILPALLGHLHILSHTWRQFTVSGRPKLVCFLDYERESVENPHLQG